MPPNEASWSAARSWVQPTHAGRPRSATGRGARAQSNSGLVLVPFLELQVQLRTVPGERRRQATDDLERLGSIGVHSV
jgi:hypothetical protein